MVSTLSGYKNEIIDSIIDGYNIAINGYTEEEKKKKSSKSVIVHDFKKNLEKIYVIL